MVSCPMMPLGPASVGSGEGSVFSQAARVAEAAGRAQAEGKKRRCSRNSNVVVTAAECFERFRAGDPVCVNEFHGRCSTGALEEAKEEKNMANYGTCAVCGKKGNRDKDDHCYRPECKKAREKVQVQPKSAGAPAEAQECRPSEEVQAQPQASPVLAREEVAALDEAAGQDHFAEPSKKAPDLPEDLDRPFVLAGIEFAPLHKRRQSGENYVALRTTSLGISTAAEAELGLKRYTHARYTVSLDGTAVAIKFLTEKKPGALCVNRSTGSMAISAQPLASKHPELIGKKARLEATDVRDWFVARFGGEAA